MTSLEKKLIKLLRHIEHVRENTQTMGFKLIEHGDVSFGINLIANGQKHDNSKFVGMEFDGLDQVDDKNLLSTCVKQHNRSNMHHPEYWGGIQNMPDLFIAEMVCDWKARSSEIGTDFLDWIDIEAPKRFMFEKDDLTHKKIMKYAELLLEQKLFHVK